MCAALGLSGSAFAESVCVESGALGPQGVLGHLWQRPDSRGAHACRGRRCCFISLPSGHGAPWCRGSERWQSLLPVRPEARHLSCPPLSCQAAEGALLMAPYGSHAVDQGPSLGILEQIQKDQAWPFPGMGCRLLPAPCGQLFLLPGAVLLTPL